LGASRTPPAWEPLSALPASEGAYLAIDLSSQGNSMHPRRTFYLRADVVQDVLDRYHLSHLRFADHVGRSRSSWSQVFNGHRPLSPGVRRDLLASRYLRGIDEASLWRVVEPVGQQP
jgi:hypothetical protein